jgi:hypothetical protein
MARRKKDGAVPMGKPKRGRPAKPKAARPGIGHNQADDDERRALFLNHVSKRKRLIEAKDAAVAALRDDAKSIKASGLTVAQVEVAIRMQTPEGESAVRERIASELQAAKWVGSAIGTQFSFDLEDRTPAVDRAYDEGKQAFLEDKRATPPYAPGVPQYTQWLSGYHDAQDARVRGGLKPLVEDEEQEDGDIEGTGGWGDSDPARPLDAA